jgi:hypothetical protein
MAANKSEETIVTQAVAKNRKKNQLQITQLLHIRD